VLAAINPDTRESRFLRAEAALFDGDLARARAAAATLDINVPTARVAALMARIAFANQAGDEARAWIDRSAGAPLEPDWSDLDPEAIPSPIHGRTGPGWFQPMARPAS